MKQVYIIAEAGVNHNGNKEMAFKLVDMAAVAGADAIKFQTFKAENIATEKADKAIYQKRTTDEGETQLDLLKRLELSHEVHNELIEYCRERKIDFLSTAFDLESLEFLVNDLKLTTLKIPSGEITNGPLLLAYAQTGCNLILSTGMSSLGEIEQALGLLAFGLLNDNIVKPSRAAFLQAYSSLPGQQILKEKVTVLHCTTEYPAPLRDININAMLTMKNTFGLEIGYSDHSEGITVPIVATALGATLIEKHFTLDKTLPGPDHKASLNPDELVAMVKEIRTVEQVMGNGIKCPHPSEINNRQVVRKSLVALKDINSGDVFSGDNITAKRSGIGINPMQYWDIIGLQSPINFIKDDNILL